MPKYLFPFINAPPKISKNIYMKEIPLKDLCRNNSTAGRNILSIIIIYAWFIRYLEYMLIKYIYCLTCPTPCS